MKYDVLISQNQNLKRHQSTAHVSLGTGVFFFSNILHVRPSDRPLLLEYCNRQVTAMKLLVLVLGFLSPWMNVSGQSVAQQCLLEQLRNVNNNNLNQQQPTTAQDATLNAFHSICQNFQQYIQCFRDRLPNSNDPPDAFLSLLFDPVAMNVAYRGLCQDINVIEQNIQCLLSTPQVRQCYNTFNQGVLQVVNLQTQGQLPRITLQNIACNVSVTRYQCETAVYQFCSQAAGQVMQDFFFAGIPRECRDSAGVTSRYVQLWSASVSIHASVLVYLIPLALLLLTIHLL